MLRKVRVPDMASAGASALKTSSLEEFGSEDDAATTAAMPDAYGTSSASLRSTGRPIGLFLLLLLGLTLAGAGAALWRLRIAPARAAAATGSLTIESDPAGLAVMANNVEQGRTPLTLSLPAGTHRFELVRDGAGRQPLTVALAGGATVVHHVKFEPVAAPVAATGTLTVTTEPGRLRVTVDGVARGLSPVTVPLLPAGSHRIDVQSGSGVLTRTVDVAAGQTASVIVTASAPAQGAGWLTVASPVPVQLFEGADLLGTSDSPRLMLPSGRHTITLTNTALGYTDSRVVQVPANGAATLRVELPRTPMSLNALPWAQAWIDGTPVGETPIGNHPVAIGPHEVVFRHPELGERRQTVVVTLTAPARVSVDLRK